jgi:hypothetical protein
MASNELIMQKTAFCHRVTETRRKWQKLYGTRIKAEKADLKTLQQKKVRLLLDPTLSDFSAGTVYHSLFGLSPWISKSLWL